MKKFLTLILIIGVILYFGFLKDSIENNVEQNNKQNKQEELLREEINKVYNLNYNNEQVDMNIKTTSEYGKIEEIIKKHYNELYSYQKELNDLKFYATITNILDSKNLNNADLNKSKNQVNDLYERSMDKIDKIISLLDEEYALSLGNGISKDYINLYESLILPTNHSEVKQSWINKKENLKEANQLASQALNVLINNKNLWHIENNKLYFHDEKLLKEYNSIINSLQSKKI